MSKGHKKRYRAQAAFSTPPEKPTPETSISDEPIKLEKVLVSDEFYWEVPGDVPASDRRYGMRMVPQGIPKPSASTETSNPSSLMTNRTEEVESKPTTENKDSADTTIQARNNTTQQVDNVSAPLVADNMGNSEASPQFQKHTIDRAADNPSKTVTETKPTVAASIQSQSDTINHNEDVIKAETTESKIKVAASILPRTGTASPDTDHHAGPAAKTAEIKSDTHLDSSQQQTVIANRRIEPEQVVPSKPSYEAKKDERSSWWRPALVALLLLLALGGILYDALFNNDENVTSLVNRVEQPVVEQYQPEQVDVITPPVAEINSNNIAKTATNVETSQLKQVRYITHVVVKGDTLWDISKRYLNDPFRYPELADLSNIKNPDLIYPGEIITIATTQSVESGVQAQVSDKTVVANVETGQLKQVRFISHVVVKGDTLWDISKKYLNNPFRYPELAKLSKIKNPDLIYPGDIIRIQMN